MSAFCSIDNGVYFAVKVISRLKKLFFALDKTYLQLLASTKRIQTFSPKLVSEIQIAIDQKIDDHVLPSKMDNTTFDPKTEGNLHFPDSNSAHVFKCQRDNFYALYRHYHDTSSMYEFKMEVQIQVIY